MPQVGLLELSLVRFLARAIEMINAAEGRKGAGRDRQEVRPLSPELISLHHASFIPRVLLIVG